MKIITVIGSGTWGGALAIHLAKKGHIVYLCSTNENKAEIIRMHREIPNLPGIKLDNNIIVTSDMETAVKKAEVVVLAVASIYTRSVARKLSPFVEKDKIILEVAKGFEEDTLLTLEDVIREEIPQAKVAILSGPNHAEEVSRGIPTSCVIGTKKKSDAEYLQSIFNSDMFKVYINPDVLGIAIGGAVKNVIALAAGIADGLGYGDNTKATLITRGIAEISRLGTAMGANVMTFAGLSGIGDLIATCASMHSRNRRAGIFIGQGKTTQEAMDEVGMVVEGVYAARSTLNAAKKYGVEMPIVNEVNCILFNKKTAKQAMSDLMLRDNIIEISNIPWPEEDR